MARILWQASVADGVMGLGYCTSNLSATDTVELALVASPYHVVR